MRPLLLLLRVCAGRSPCRLDDGRPLLLVAGLRYMYDRPDVPCLGRGGSLDGCGIIALVEKGARAAAVSLVVLLEACRRGGGSLLASWIPTSAEQSVREAGAR